MPGSSLLSIVWNHAFPGYLAGLLLAGVGIATLILSLRGSVRYPAALAALGVALLIMLVAIWMQPVIRDANMRKAMSITSTFDPVDKAEAWAHYYRQRASLLGLLIFGLLMSLLSLLFRRGPVAMPRSGS